MGGGVATEPMFQARRGAGARQSPLRHRHAHTTIPSPSSIEEEGGRWSAGARRLDLDRPYLRLWKNRLGWAFMTQVQGLKIDAPAFQLSMMIWALPSRFSAGT